MERQRLDKWLWHARVVKARTSAAALIEAGHVRVNGVREKAPGHSVKIGDVSPSASIAPCGFSR